MYLFQSTQFLFSSPRIAQKRREIFVRHFQATTKEGKRRRKLPAEKTGQLSYKSASFLFSLDPTLLSSEQEREKMKGVREGGWRWVGRLPASKGHSRAFQALFFAWCLTVLFSGQRGEEGGGSRTHNEAILGPRPHHLIPFFSPPGPISLPRTC